MRTGFSVASRLPAISDWYRWKMPAGIGDDWDTSPSKGVRYCAFCWWKRRRSRYATRTRRWCSVEHRVIDCGVLLLFKEEFEVVIMIRTCGPKRCMGRTEFLA